MLQTTYLCELKVPWSNQDKRISLLPKKIQHQWTEIQIIDPRYEISNNVACTTSKGSDQPVHTCSLIRAFASRLNIF